MVVVSKSVLRDFAEKYPEAANAVFKWYEVVCSADWKNFSEMKKSFNSVDAVGNDRYVFNLRGNHFRLIALIIFKVRTVFILYVGIHRDYDQLDASSITFKRFER
jgi:mRNA interferase HigB